MKKLLTLAALLALVSAPAFANEAGNPSIVKGTKPYQTKSSADAMQNQPQADDVTSPSDLEPAAGADSMNDMDAQPDTTEQLQDSMKLPRKN